MQDEMLSCRETRRQLASYLAGEPHPALAEHLTGCEACLEACMDEALRRPPDVPVSKGFQQRLLARIPESTPVEPPVYPWAHVVAACLFATLGAAVWWSGRLPQLLADVTDVMGSPLMLAAAIVVEIVLSLLWFWRVATERY